MLRYIWDQYCKTCPYLGTGPRWVGFSEGLRGQVLDGVQGALFAAELLDGVQPRESLGGHRPCVADDDNEDEL